MVLLMKFWKAKKATPPTTPCGESRWGSCHWGGTFEISMAHQVHLVKQRSDAEINQNDQDDETTSQCDEALFCQKSRNTISEHLKNIFNDNKLDENSVVRKNRTTAADDRQEQQNILLFGLSRLHFCLTQPPRLWGSCLTRNLGVFFMPAVLSQSISTGRMQ